jgi:hypothetical protein
MAEHYYPGQTIPLGELTGDGWTHQWNNAFVRDLPPLPNAPWYAQDPGADYYHPSSNQTAGANPVMFNITGEGRPVDFFVTGGHLGFNMLLHKRKTVGTDAFTKYGESGTSYRDTWTVYGDTEYWSTSSRYYHPDDPNDNSTPTYAALRITLLEGETYFLEIGTSTYDSRLGLAGSDQDLSLTVAYTRQPTNDLRANAWNVHIGSSGVFTDIVLNEGFTHLFDASDNDSPSSNPMYRDAWWSYVPETSGDVTASFAILPGVIGTSFGLQMWERASDGAMTMLERQTSNPGSVTHAVVADHTYLFQIGWVVDPSNQTSGQRYQLSVEGPETAGDIGTEGAPPGNDKRADAWVIPELGGVTANSDITYATRDTGDYGDPWALKYEQSVWWKYTAVRSGTAELTMRSSLYTEDMTLWCQVIDASDNDNLVIQRAIVDSPFVFQMIKDHTYFFCYGVVRHPSLGKYNNVWVALTLEPPEPPPTKPVTKKPNPKKPVAPKPDACSTILDLVREFQRATGYAVEIIDSTTIRVFDPYEEPIPVSFDEGLGEYYYPWIETTMAASSKVINLEGGTMDMTARADLEDDDIGIVTSGWTLPDPLPFPGTYPAPVTRVSYTFTPERFKASVEFMFPDAPMRLRALEE